MATASLTISDDDDQPGRVQMAVNFGPAVNEQSPAHQMINNLANSVLQSFEHAEEVEPHEQESRILVPSGRLN